MEDYVSRQTERHTMADPRVQNLFQQYQKTYSGHDLSQPVLSAHGQYWYNLHLVLVNDDRWREVRPDVLDRLSEMIERVGAKYGERISTVGLLADHIHMTVGCQIDRSPEETALSYLNNCAYAIGMKPHFQFGCYAGTIGEYDRGAVL